jgi:hypothetical protein
MSRSRQKWIVGPCALLFIAGMALATGAQEQSSQQGQQTQSQPNQNGQNTDQSAAPIPAYHSPLASAAPDNGAADSGELEPDTRTLSGVQTLSLGGLKTGHSYWQPHIDIFESADSNSQITTTGYTWGSWTSVSGGVDLHHVSANTDLMLSYLGGGSFSPTEGTNGGMVQQLGFTYRFQLRRWTILFLDQFSYLPESGFGFGGQAGLPLSGGSIGGIGSAFQPGGTLLVGQGRNVSNILTTEGDLKLTPRTSITLVGGYSLLVYPDSNLFNSWEVSARIGYNYLWTRKDTVALYYTYNGLRYSNSDQSIDTHSIQVSYGRRITGRLAFQVAAGPEIAVAKQPITLGGNGIPSANSTQVFLSLDATAQYQLLRRTDLSATYSHWVSSGSGVLAGSIADSAQGSATRRISPTFSSGLTAGYSRNSGVALQGLVPINQNYNYWYVGANASHPLGVVGVTLSYQMQYQDSNAQFCTGATCGTSLIRHLISVGVGWHGSRVVLR